MLNGMNPEMHSHIADKVRSLLDERRLTNKWLAEATGYTPKHVGQVLNLKAAPSSGMVKRIAEALNVSEMDLLGMSVGDVPILTQEDFVTVPYLEATPSCGGGSWETSKSIKSHLSFRRDWLMSKGNPERMAVLRARGDSMSPTIPDGASVLVDESQNELAHNKVFLVVYGDQIYIKRLIYDVDHWVLRSDFDGSVINIDEGCYFEIVGRCLWYCLEL